MLTIQEMEDDRARGLDAIDDILNTAREAERSLTADERGDIDYINAHVDAHTESIDRARQTEGDDILRSNQEARRSWQAPSSINFNRITVAPPTATRSLDELLHASADSVIATNGVSRNPVESTVVRSLDGTQVLSPRMNEILPEQRETVRSFQATVADMCLAGMLAGKGSMSSSEGFQLARSLPQFKDRWTHVLRAMDVDTAAEGTEWVPTGIGASVHEKVRAQGKVGPLFPRINIPTNPWKMPIAGADVTAYRVAEPTGDTESKMTASTPGTVAATFDAEIFGARSLWSKSLDMDSIVAILPYATSQFVHAFVAAEETAVINGDTDGTHQDSDIGSTTTVAQAAWDGLRKKAIAQTVATATTITALNLGVVRKAMGKWGLDPTELAFIIGPANAHTLLADTNLLTVDKMGPQAVILNGQIGSVFGVPVVVSEHMRENLNASGVYDGITTTKTAMICVRRTEWAFGQREALDIEVNDSLYGETYQRVLYGFMREDFQHIGSAATNEDTAIAYNVTP